MTDCIFCRIAAGALAAHVIHEGELVMAFLDTHPIRLGHLQLIPREHHAYFDDLPTATAGHLVQVGQKLAKALKCIYAVTQVAFLFSGSDVAHAHAHVIPVHEKTDITSRRYVAEQHLTFQPLPAASGEEMSSNVALLRSTLGSRAR